MAGAPRHRQRDPGRDHGVKKYRFRLETVLRVRRIQEEQARYALLAANRAVLEAAQEVATRRETLDDHTVVAVPTTHDGFMASHYRGELLAGAVRTAAAREIEALDVQVDKRDAWGEQAQRVASLERLDERTHELYRVEANRDELKTVDDIVTGRYARGSRHA